jgi:hypothetical protein
MGIEPSRDSRYVAAIIGYSCRLPSKSVHNPVTDAKNRDRSAQIPGDLMRQKTQQGAHVRRLGSVTAPVFRTVEKGAWIWRAAFPTRYLTVARQLRTTE